MILFRFCYQGNFAYSLETGISILESHSFQSLSSQVCWEQRLNNESQCNDNSDEKILSFLSAPFTFLALLQPKLFF